MRSNFHVIIPARLNSSRLPGKLLMEVQGQTILERVYRQALLACPLSIVIATDSEVIEKAASAWGARVVMTSTAHESGTDRIAEVVSLGGYAGDDIVINIQGDEPLIDPALIQQVARVLSQSSAPMATLCWPIEDEAQCNNPNVVKVVRDVNDHALYFSRQAIPFHRDNPLSIKGLFRHIGLYAYRADFLLNVVNLPVCELEKAEALEQLRILWAGFSIHVEKACVRPLQDINTLDDLTQLRQALS
jgi:3-deoxy-manno-octulosonate cytidylyltransferase (CMP-KDO synthetase)